jgi:hypothetical protein
LKKVSIKISGAEDYNDWTNWKAKIRYKDEKKEIECKTNYLP